MPDAPTPNPIVTLLPAFLRALATVAKDPALGYRGAAVTSALAFTATAIERGAEAKAEFDELSKLVHDLAASGKEAEKQVWYDFKARGDAAESIFNPPAPAPEPAPEKDE